MYRVVFEWNHEEKEEFVSGVEEERVFQAEQIIASYIWSLK